jgi:hypothetical protein
MAVSQREINNRIITILGVMTGGDMALINDYKQISSPRDSASIRSTKRLLFEEWGFPRAEVILADLKRAHEGGELKYFKDAQAMADEARRRVGVPTGQEMHGPESLCQEDRISDFGGLKDLIESYMDRDEPTSLALDADTTKNACYNEQRHFYDSPEWYRPRKAMHAIARFKCERCGNRDSELQAHHRTRIYTIYSKVFYKNFSTIHIDVWCRDCHEEYHQKAAPNEYGFEYRPDKVDKRKAFYRRRREYHDKQRECKYCRNFVWAGEEGT